jgi:hypothetical protein
MDNPCEHCKYFDDIADDTHCVTCLPPDYKNFIEKLVDPRCT